VLIVEGIFALYDQRVLDLLDMKVCHLHRKVPIADILRYLQRQTQIHAWLEEVCLLDIPKLPVTTDTRQVTRDVEHRGRDIEGCIKQWFAFVKPNFERFVEPQRKKADIIVPRGIQNKVAIGEIRRAPEVLASDHQQT
jgi:uridine kinase